VILPFLYHHLDRAKRGEITNALVHCHVRGLTSIMLHEAPGNSIRLFYAHEGHEMAWSLDPAEPMPLAIHGHRTDLSLVGLFGRAASVVYTQRAGAPLYEACEFRSVIAKEGGEMVPLGVRTPLWDDRSRLLAHGCDQALKAHELHTVVVPKGEAAAWLVFEGAVDPDPSHICYTNNPNWDPAGLYRPAPQVEVLNVLARTIMELP
jgi:hypothetical protein